jgi:hypothetical protein
MNIQDRILRAEALRAMSIYRPFTRPEDIPDLACEAVAAGIDTQAVLEIAAMIRPTWVDLSDRWFQMLKELSLPVLSDAQAAHLIILPEAHEIGRRSFEESIDPFVIIASLEAINDKYGQREFLHSFSILYSEWAYLENEYPGKYRSELEEEFRQALATLMALVPFDPADPKRTNQTLYCNSIF